MPNQLMPYQNNANAVADLDVLAARMQHADEHERETIAANTERARRADSAIFAAWCIERRVASMPASPATVAAFVDDMSQHRKPATVRRYLATISKMHTRIGLESPTRSYEVSCALKRMANVYGREQEQAAPMTFDVLHCLLAPLGDRLGDLRDAALLRLGYDLLARRSELVALNVGDLEQQADGSAIVPRLYRKKTKHKQAAYVRPATVAALDAWCIAAGITDGAIFRSVRGSRVGDRLDGGDVARIVKRRAARAGLDAERVAAISGHSLRVGAAVDMRREQMETGAIAQSGGWRSTKMVEVYTRNAGAMHSAMARLAARQDQP